MKPSPNDASYSWHYSSKFDEIKGSLSLDSIKEGNLLRFVNDYEKHNCKVMYLPIGNMWRIFYVANKNVPAGTELSISYGKKYWRKRE